MRRLWPQTPANCAQRSARRTARFGSFGAIVTERLSVRQRLLDAAYAAISDKGFETSRIADIIEAAGVGVGSFYNHFDSKDDLAASAFEYRVEAFGRELEAVVKGAPDAAAATCFVYRRMLERAEQDEAWATFILQMEPSFRMFDKLMRPHARQGLQIGVDDGTFQIEDLEAGISAILSSERAHRSSKFALLMFGVDATIAQELSQLPMIQLHEAVKP